MAKLTSNQNVAKAVGAKQYTKISEGGIHRAKAAVNYIDKHEQENLYVLDNRGDIEISDRYAINDSVDVTKSKYVQHWTLTTRLDKEEIYLDKEEYARYVAKSIREVRPDAEIYAIAIHDGDSTDKYIHSHVVFGTDTTLRNEQRERLRDEAKKCEELIIDKSHKNVREIDQQERGYIERNRGNMDAAINRRLYESRERS